MKLVRIGNIIINMDNLLAIKDDSEKMYIFFSGSSNEKVLSITLDEDNALQMRKWLSRNGVNDLSTESPKINWYIE